MASWRSFAGPTRAAECARALAVAMPSLGSRYGPDCTAERLSRPADIGGIAVHVAARIAALVGWREVLVGDNLRELRHFMLRPGDAAMWVRYFAHGSAATASLEDRRGMVVVMADGAHPGFDGLTPFQSGCCRS